MSDDEENYDGGGISTIRQQQQQQQQFALPQPPPNQGPPSVSLAFLIDFAVQRTYQDLTVLSELLPKKSDMERKISIVQFAHSTRQLFIRLLAAVKWAKSAGKVDLCTGITYFLDQQAQIFVETADRMFQLSHEALPQARLPAFQIPAAVDVLVLGSYPRLPACIKTRFVPDESINAKEQACVLRRLNQVIQHRLVFSNVQLPSRMQNFTIRNGMVTFTVPAEFEASLTLLGEEPNLPWSLLNIKILAEDYEIGEGADLVHPYQVHYIHDVAEARMSASENPIADLYDVLHTFCVYLQLDILFCQASKFVHDRMIEHVSVDEYVQGQKLVLTYWKTISKRAIAMGPQSTTNLAPGFNYKIIVQVDSTTKKGVGALRVSHSPGSDVRLPTLDDYEQTKNGKLNVENLLCDTILIRIRYRLTQLKQRMDEAEAGNSKICGKVPTLEIAMLEPRVVESEKLLVSINLFTGHFVCSVEMLGKSRILEEMERLLNLAQWHKIGEKMRDLKIALLMERCRKTVVGLPVAIADSVPLLPSSTTLRFLSPNRLLLRFSRHEAYYLVVEFLPEGQSDCKMRHFLLSTTSVASEKNRETSGVCEFVKPVKLLSLDSDAFASLDPPYKIVKRDSHLMPDLAAVIGHCDQRIPFILLCEEFDRKGIKYQALREEDGVECEVLNVLGFTKVSNAAEKKLVDRLWSQSVVSLSGRLMHDRNRLHWTFELLVANLPVMGKHQKAIGGESIDGSSSYQRVQVTNTPVSPEGAAKCADELVNIVCAFARFYDLIVRWWPSVVEQSETSSPVCNVLSLSINRLVLSYGPGEKEFFVMLQWKQHESAFHMLFGSHYSGGGGGKVGGTKTAAKTTTRTDGTTIKEEDDPMEGQIKSIIESGDNRSGNADQQDESSAEQQQQRGESKVAENPHTLMASFVQSMFNDRRDLAELMQYLSDTIEPLLALHRLPQWPSIGVGDNQTQPSGFGHLFALLPVNGTTIRVIYKWHACFEVQMMANGEVALRDCASEKAEKSTTAAMMKSATRFIPIAAFKSFFEMHERIAGNLAANAPPPSIQAPPSVASSPSAVASVEAASTSRPSSRQKADILEKSSLSESPSKTLVDSVKTESPPPSYQPAPSPSSTSVAASGVGGVGTMIAPSPLSASTPAGVPPSPTPASNFPGLFTPSPAPGPASNAGMLMTPSPAPFANLQSPASASAPINSVPSADSSVAAAPASIPAAPPLSPATRPPQEPSPVSFLKSFAEETAAGDNKSNSGEFTAWGGEFSNMPVVTPITTAAPMSLDSLPQMSSVASTAPGSVSAAAALMSVSGIGSVGGGPMLQEESGQEPPSPSITDDWAPSGDPIVISHAAFRAACSNTIDGRNTLKEFLASVTTLSKFSTHLNSQPLNLVSGPGTTSSRVGTLDVKIYLDDKRMTSLQMKVSNTQDGGDSWTDDDMRVMEQYFAEFVAPIQHQHAVITFLRFLLFSKTVHVGAPKSLVALMRNQLKRDTTKPWSPSLCLVLPAPHLVTPYLTTIGAAAVIPGMMAIMVNREQHKMLLWIRLMSNIDRKQQWMFPLLYDGDNNGLAVFTASTAQQQTATLAQFPIINEVNSILSRFNYSNECSIWTSINGLAEALSHQQPQSQMNMKPMG